jgi:proteic killer suppression protein
MWCSTGNTIALSPKRERASLSAKLRETAQVIELGSAAAQRPETRLRLVKRCVTCYDPFMIKNFRHKGLQRFFEKGSKSGIQARHERRLRLMPSRLDDVTKAKDMDAPGWKLHALKGDLKGHWAVWVDANWRLTFTFDGKDAILVNYQDYH